MEGCRYKNCCKFSGNGCFDEDENICPKAKDLCARFCPLMVAAGAPIKNCACDIPSVRKLWPQDKKCFEGHECLPRRHKAVQSQIEKVTDESLISASFAAA